MSEANPETPRKKIGEISSINNPMSTRDFSKTQIFPEEKLEPLQVFCEIIIL